MSTSTTTTTTTAPTGEVTIQKVEEAWGRDVSAVHTFLSHWLSHIETVAKSGAWVGLATAAFTFAKHIV